MKKISTLLLLVLAAFLVSAQNYRPFPESGSYWNEEHGVLLPGSCGYEYHTCKNPVYFGTDTAINSTAYHRLFYRQVCSWQLTLPPVPPCVFTSSYNIGEALFACIRQDTVLRRVYVYDFSTSAEMLLYDFNLSAGDTLPPAYNNPFYPNVQVVRVDSILLPDGYHRRCVLNVPTYSQDSAALIEGIGSNFGLLAALVSPFENHDLLLCYSNSGQTIYPDASAICLISLGIPPVAGSFVQVYPNPFRDKIFLQTGYLQEEQVEIFAGDGRLMLSVDSKGGDQVLDVSGLAEGVYFLRCSGRLNYVTRLVKL